MMGESSKHAAFRPGNENMCLLCNSINECSIKACAYHIWPLFSRKWKANLHLSRDCKKSAVGDERSKENHVQVIAILYWRPTARRTPTLAAGNLADDKLPDDHNRCRQSWPRNKQRT